ncbi:MAG: beta-N-acetylhexosaminidase [Treponema sp.]|jgi:hexosaminidase|nr:beta-N-acetylhexosaminidase [Treponema sp.]
MTEQLSIIPRPVSVKYEEGVFQSEGLFIAGDEDFKNEIETVICQLRDDFKMSGGLNLSSNKEEKPVFCKRNEKIANNEGYRLVISKDRITIEASSARGAYHGLQTFRQLALSEFRSGTLTMPCAEIDDCPSFPWRGFMLDCSRYFYSVPFIKQLINVLSLHHINRFHWHLTDDQGWRFPVVEYPLLTEIGSRRKDHRLRWIPYIGGYYTENEIREVVDYAAKSHIEIIPEVDLPGHASAILASYPDLGCTGGPYCVEDRFGIFEDVLCAGNDKIFDLAEKVFDALVRLFPSKWVHIGGDEVLFNRWEKCPKCQKTLAELGLKKTHELQSWITHRLVQLLAERGKTAIGWDEILNDSEKFCLPKETVVMSWRGETGGIRASRLGHHVVMTPNTCGCYLDYKHINAPEEPGQLFEGTAAVYKSWSLYPVTPEMTEKEAARILGGQGNLWSELIYAGKIAEYMIFPRICAIAEAVWSPRETRDFDDFSRRLIVHRGRLDFLGINQYRGALREIQG